MITYVYRCFLYRLADFYKLWLKLQCFVFSRFEAISHNTINSCEYRDSWPASQSSGSLSRTHVQEVASFFSSCFCFRFNALAKVNRHRKRVCCRLLATLKCSRLSWLWPLTGGAVSLKKSMGRSSAGLPWQFYSGIWWGRVAAKNEVDRSFSLCPFRSPTRKGGSS